MKVFQMLPMGIRLARTTLVLVVASLGSFDVLPAAEVFRAGASAVDITPEKLPVRQNGGFLERTVDGVVDPLHARALVLDDGSTRLAIVVVDSCMVTREVCDEVKALAFARSGIAAQRILIAATHTHSAPSVMNFCLGSRADAAYRDALPPLIAQAIETATKRLRPAQIGWTVTEAPELTNCRRWITRPDRMQEDPFGERTVRAMMHPGHQNPDYIGPAGPIDPGLSLLSVRSPDGAPIALLANYSMHYFGVGGGLSADYCGRFAEKIATKLSARATSGADSPVFVGVLSQGTSGDLHWMDYSAPRKSVNIEAYSDGLVEIALEAYHNIRHHRWVSLAMAEKRLTLKRRVPDEKRLAWARRLRPDPTQRPRNRPEVYAEQALYIHENPTLDIVLQAVRIGELGITAIPCEVYGITGLQLKARSPLRATFNMELANGAAGYIPPPEQHALGGYTTWPARTAGLEVAAEPRIVEAVLGLLELVSGRTRREPHETRGAYPDAILSGRPWAYLRMSDFGGPIAADASGHGRSARYEGGVARYLPGPVSPAFSGEDTNRAVHLAGGRLRLPDTDGIEVDYSIEMWFWNGLETDARDITGYLFSFGDDRLAISGTQGKKPGRLWFRGLHGETAIPIRTWNHVIFVRHGLHVTVWLNGRAAPELQLDTPPDSEPARQGREILIGSSVRNVASFEGKIDEVAIYDRALSSEEMAAHCRASGLSVPQERASVHNEPPRPVPPLSPADTLKVTHVRRGFVLELVAAEPLVMDPVAIDWGPNGGLWVAEMADYPSGMDGHGKPGGRIRFLEDSDGDSRYDRSVVFLDGVRFPTGVMAWRDGVLVTAAPEIFYAEDTDGDGRADRREVLFTGFLSGNQQLRVNGLRYGLDNWIYCASGGHHAGYGVRNTVKVPGSGIEVLVGSRDFRIRPGDGLLDPEAGPSQFGRVRDDWGNWFGVQNSHPLWHYVLRDRQSRRNPYVAAPDPRHQLHRRANPRVYPAKAPQKRFHSFEQSGRFTSACGPSIYRDELLFGPGEVRHAFICEPFHNVVQHIILTEDGVSFTAERPAREGERDFLASADRWCRPVMTRTAPDGSLWVVDMYRYIIEHPEWLPQVGKDELRPFFRAGDDRGRIYRIYPEGKRPRQVLPLGNMSSARLVDQLANSNGHVRDTTQRLLVDRDDLGVVQRLEHMAAEHPEALGRLHALSTLEGMGVLKTELIVGALADRHPGVVRHALRLAEPRGTSEPAVVAAAVKLVHAPDAKVRLELASSLGAWTHRRAGQALAEIAVASCHDPWMRAAVLSSTVPHYSVVVEAVSKAKSAVLESMLEPLAEQGLKSGRYDALARLLTPVVTADRGELDTWHYDGFGRFLDVLDRNRTSLENLRERGGDALKSCFIRVDTIFHAARKVAADTWGTDTVRVAALRLLGRVAASREQDVALLRDLISPRSSNAVQIGAVRALGRVRTAATAASFLSGWSSYLPGVRAVVADQILQSAAWSTALLESIARGEITRATLGATERQRLLRHGSKTVARLAKDVFSSDLHADRAAVVEKFRPALELTGDRARGAAIFQRTCSACHSLEDDGKLIGPDLRSLTDRSGEGLLTSVVDPSRKVDPRYLGYNAILADGDIVFGLIAGETGNSIVFQLADGRRFTVLRSRVASLESTGLSFMPTGLEADLTVERMADLIEFLKRL